MPHPAGIVLRRSGYYTLPPLDELARLTDERGRCEVDGFTVGREGYGNVFFPGVTDVSGFNLDDIGLYQGDRNGKTGSPQLHQASQRSRQSCDVFDYFVLQCTSAERRSRFIRTMSQNPLKGTDSTRKRRSLWTACGRSTGRRENPSRCVNVT